MPSSFSRMIASLLIQGVRSLSEKERLLLVPVASGVIANAFSYCPVCFYHLTE